MKITNLIRTQLYCLCFLFITLVQAQDEQYTTWETNYNEGLIALDTFDFEAANRVQLRGNIYLAKVTRVEPSLQAAFVAILFPGPSANPSQSADGLHNRGRQPLARAVRPDTHGAAFHPRDRTATGADRLDIDNRHE